MTLGQRIGWCREDDSNEVSDTRGNEAGSKDEANNNKEQVVRGVLGVSIMLE